MEAQPQQNAFILRIAPSGIDKVPEALEENQIIIGWSDSKGLLDPLLTREEFREILRKQFHQGDDNLRAAGASTGNMWRFIRDMQVGDLVVVPYGPNFYVAEVTGPPTYIESKVSDDTAYRRNVTWLNSKQPIPRDWAKAALYSRMKMQGASVYATDLLFEIRECLERATSGEAPSFVENLQKRLIEETLKELRGGYMHAFAFERFIQQILRKLGADEARVIATSKDKGADIVATFRIARTISQTVAVQAKWWGPEPPVGRDVVRQLERGIEAETAALGLVITTGSISEEAVKEAQEYFDKEGIRIEPLDGKQFAKLIVELGISLPIFPAT